MKLWKKVALSIIFTLIPAPDVEIVVKIDMNNDGKSDVILNYNDFRLGIEKN